MIALAGDSALAMYRGMGRKVDAKEKFVYNLSA